MSGAVSPPMLLCCSSQSPRWLCSPWRMHSPSCNDARMSLLLAASPRRQCCSHGLMWTMRVVLRCSGGWMDGVLRSGSCVRLLQEHYTIVHCAGDIPSSWVNWVMSRDYRRTTVRTVSKRGLLGRLHPVGVNRTVASLFTCALDLQLISAPQDGRRRYPWNVETTYQAARCQHSGV